MERPSSLLELVFGWARDDGGREAVVAPNVRLSYSQLAAAVDGAATALRRAGLAAGARVAFLGSPGPAFLISELATHAAGGVWLGLNPKYTAPELTHVLGDAAPSLVVVDVGHDGSALRGVIAELPFRPMLQELANLSDLADVPGPLQAPEVVLPGEVALLVYTSGTTGTPKGAMLTHRGMVEAGRLYDQRYRHDDLRTLLNLPINHVGALIDLTMPAMFAGGALVTMQGFDPAAIPDLMRDERVSLLGQVPAMHLAIDAARPYDPSSLPFLRHLVWSGAAMPRSWIEDRIDGRVELSTCYGLTECTGAATFTRPGAGVDELADTVGTPAHDGLLKLVGGDGREVAAGEPGEVRLRGDLLMAGYLNRPEATAEAFDDDGWLRTGDLGMVDGGGAVRLVGRMKEMFKSGGYNVYPREVETALETHDAVIAAAIVSVPDPRWQEVGWAFVISNGSLTADALDAHARARLANYKVPKRYVIASELPLLPIGKIDKQALKRAVTDGAYG